MMSGAWRRAARSAVGKSGASIADLHLLDEAFAMLMLVLDRILDGDDVPRVAAVDLVHQRRQRRRLAGSGRPADEHQTARQARERLDVRRQAQRRQPRHGGGSRRIAAAARPRS